MARLIARLSAAIVLAVALASPAEAQRTRVRFYVDSVADSTFSFRVASSEDWVQVGATGIAVDPARRDALVAQFRVISLWGNRATALVTGQTTFVTVDHIAVLERPERRFYHDRSFWSGTVLGLLLGVGGALALAGG